jgi:hypothetical protein
VEAATGAKKPTSAWSLNSAEQGDLLPVDLTVMVGVETGGAELAPTIGKSEPAFWAIVTQTCDVVRDPSHEPFLHIAAVQEAPDEEAWEKGLRGRYSVRQYALPKGTAGLKLPLIDVRVLETVTKQALEQCEIAVIKTALSDAERARLAAWLGRRLGRHAFPDALEREVLRPMRYAVDKQVGGNSPAAAVLRCTERILTHYSGGSPLVEIAFVIDAAAANQEQLLTGKSAAEALSARQNAAATLLKGPIGKAKRGEIPWQIDVVVKTLEEVSAHDLWFRYHEVDGGI